MSRISPGILLPTRDRGRGEGILRRNRISSIKCHGDAGYFHVEWRSLHDCFTPGRGKFYLYPCKKKPNYVKRNLLGDQHVIFSLGCPPFKRMTIPPTCTDPDQRTGRGNLAQNQSWAETDHFVEIVMRRCRSILATCGVAVPQIYQRAPWVPL